MFDYLLYRILHWIESRLPRYALSLETYHEQEMGRNATPRGLKDEAYALGVGHPMYAELACYMERCGHAWSALMNGYCALKKERKELKEALEAAQAEILRLRLQ